MNFQLLQTELAKPELSSLSATDAATALNAETVEYHELVPTAEVANYLMKTGSSTPPLTLYMKLSLTYRNTQYPDVVRAIAESAIDLAQGQITSIDLQAADFAGMMGVLVQSGIWTQGEADALKNLGRHYKSRAVELLGESVTEADVSRARNLDALNDIDALNQRAAHGYNAVVERIAQAAITLDDVPTWDDLTQAFSEVTT